jgi:hypothetical protein
VVAHTRQNKKQMIVVPLTPMRAMVTGTLRVSDHQYRMDPIWCIVNVNAVQTSNDRAG